MGSAGIVGLRPCASVQERNSPGRWGGGEGGKAAQVLPGAVTFEGT